MNPSDLSLATAPGSRIAYPTPNRPNTTPEADLSSSTPTADGHRSVSGEGTGTLLAVLISRGAKATTGSYSVRQAEVTIGRAEDNDLVIADRSLSSRHARLKLESGIWMIDDVGSVNGTTVDGISVGETPVPVAPGSTLTLGSLELVFSPHDRWDDSIVGEVESPDSAPTANEVLAPVASANFDLGVPQKRGVPIPLLIGMVVTVIAVLGYLLSRGGS